MTDMGLTPACVLSLHMQLISLNIYFYNKKFMSVFMSACGYMHMCPGILEVSRASDSLELEAQTLVSCPVWVPGLKLESSARAVSAG